MRDAGGDVLLFAAAHTRLRFGHGLGARILMLTSWRGRGPRRLLGGFLLAGDRSRRALAGPRVGLGALAAHRQALAVAQAARSEEHTSELQSLMRISYAVFCLKKKKQKIKNSTINIETTNTHNKTHTT